MKEIIIKTEDDLDTIQQWNISQNHTKKWGAIKGKHSCTYLFMHEDKVEVLRWLSENWNK